MPDRSLFRTALDLDSPPIAVAFLAQPPAGLPRVDRTLPAGCSYWKHAAEGRGFYTLPEDHHGCAVGAFTQGAPQNAEQQKDLEGLVGTMIQLKYLSADEVPRIPHRPAPFAVLAYAPLEQATFAPDVVIVRGTPRQLMIAAEAARAAGVFDTSAIMGRPACAMIPLAMERRVGVASFGCIGNRVYTGLGDDDLYVTIPGTALEATLAELETIVHANVELEAFHRARLS
jgi:uncharacterized protein (DUF169 family)